MRCLAHRQALQICCESRGRVFNPFRRQRPDNWSVISRLITPSLALSQGVLNTPCCRWVTACCSFLVSPLRLRNQERCGTRPKQHHSAAKRHCPLSQIYEHMALTCHTFNFDEAKLIASLRRKWALLVLEVWLSGKDAINRRINLHPACARDVRRSNRRDDGRGTSNTRWPKGSKL